jgi:protein-disulfide isomerase
MKNALLVTPLLLFAPALFAQVVPQLPADDPVAMVGGQPISEEDLLRALGPQLLQLRNQEYEVKSKALESLIRHRVVEVEAERRNISADALIKREVDSKVADPTDGEVEAYFLGQTQSGVRLEDVKEQYRNTLKQLKMVKARQAYADSLRAKTEVTILLDRPSIDVPYDEARVEGSLDAPVTIVEFADFQCPFCQKTEATLKALLSKYDGRVKLAFLDFPLTEIHGQAEQAAEAARCAGEQAKFWEYHDELFADQSKLDEVSLIARAHNMHLDEHAFSSCLASGKFKQDIQANRDEGIQIGVTGTPAYFVNGVLLSGALPQAEFEKVIDHELAPHVASTRQP